MAKQPRLSRKSHSDHSQSSEAKRDYEIGYGRPPKHSRFKRGKSGNPNGRPKRQRNVRRVVEDVLSQRITIREGDRTRSLSKLDGVVLTIINKALSGDAKTLPLLITLLRSLGLTNEVPEPTGTEPVTTHDSEIIADFLRRHGTCTETGIPPKPKPTIDSVRLHGRRRNHE
jgi:uncharacterized protein DUF5681